MNILKKAAFFVLAGFLMLVQGLHAEEGLYEEDNPASKLGRGIVNVVSSPGEYVVQTAKLMENHDPLTAYCGGIFQGTWRMLERIGGGVYEIATFPIPFPKKYKPLMDPPTTVVALQDTRVLQAN
jgi:putative exosortase-associated protein (TIGR04073 family)